MNGRRIHDELVVRRAAGILAGGDHQRTGVAQLPLTPAESGLCQLGRAQVAVNSARVQNPQFFQAIGFHIHNKSS